MKDDSKIDDTLSHKSENNNKIQVINNSKNKLQDKDEDDDIIGMIQDINIPNIKKNFSNNNQFISRLQNSISLQIDNFSEDIRDEKGNCLQQDDFIEEDEFYKVDEYKIEFSYTRFLYVLILHLLFYIVLGPFTFIFLAYKPGLKLMYTFAFMPTINIAFFTQTLTWLFNLVTIIGYIVYERTNIYFIEILYMNILIFLRCAVIAAKYASLHSMRWKLYNKRRVSLQFTQYDYYLADWVQQNYRTIYTEVYHSLKRGEFDISIFYLNFFVNPKQQTIETALKHIQECKQWHKNKNDLFQPDCMYQNTLDSKNQIIFGYGIIAEIVKSFMKNNSQNSYFKYIIFISLIRGLLTYFYRLISGNNLDFSTMEIVQLIFLIINTSINCMSLYSFLFYYLRDLKQKHYGQEQCTILLDLKRQYMADSHKLFPTIDITNNFSLKAWSIIRRVLFDYGKSFDLRMQVYFQLNMIIFLVMLVVFVLWFLGVYDFPTEYVVVSVYEIFVYLILISLILIRGALINQQFEINLNIVADLKVMILDLKRLKKSYFIEKKVPANTILKRAVLKILNYTEFCKQNVSNLQNEDLQNLIRNQSKMEIITEKIQEILDSLDDCEKEIKADQINRPFRFFYLKITLGLVQTLGAGFLTLLGGLAQYYYLK